VGNYAPCAKLTSDSGSGFEAALFGDCRLFRLSAEISRPAFWECCNTIGTKQTCKWAKWNVRY